MCLRPQITTISSSCWPGGDHAAGLEHSTPSGQDRSERNLPARHDIHLQALLLEHHVCLGHSAQCRLGEKKCSPGREDVGRLGADSVEERPPVGSRIPGSCDSGPGNPVVFGRYVRRVGDLAQTGPTIPGHLRLSAERVFEQEEGVRGGRFHDGAGITVEVP